MKKHVFCCILFLLFFYISYLTSETFAGDKILTFDFMLFVTGSSEPEIDLNMGVNYEIRIFDFFSVKPSFCHTTFFPKGWDYVRTTVGIGCDALYYPFRKGLEGPYFGCGVGTEFIMFSRDDIPKETAIYLYAPVIGWKFSIKEWVFIDPFLDYRILLNGSQFSSGEVADFYGNKLQYGIKLKINFGKMFSRRKNVENSDFHLDE